MALAVLSPPAPGPMRVMSPACSVENVSAFSASGTQVGSSAEMSSGCTEADAPGPVVDCLRVRPAGLVDAAVEVLEVRLRDGEDEGGDGVIRHGFLLR